MKARFTPNILKLLSLACLYGGTSPALHAQEATAEIKVVPEEFVFTNFVANQKMGRMFGDIGHLLPSDERIEAEDGTSHVTLVRVGGSDGDTSDVTVSLTRWNNLCQKIKESRRSFLRNDNSVERERAASLLNSYVRRCAPNGVFSASAIPNDSSFGNLWGMNQSNDIDIDAPEAWDLFTGTKQVVVAVIDTGVQYNHPDLSANMWVNTGEVAGNGIDDDGNGYVDDIHGINAINGSGNPMDDNNHGTHCAGTIGGKGNNSSGVAGVNWDVSIMGVKFLGSNGSGSLYDAVEGIDYVTSMKQRGVNVVVTSNSWGCPGCNFSPLYDAIQRSKDAGILFAAAAGNSSNNNDSNQFYPAGYSNENLIAVAAVDQNGSLASFSNYGATSVDLGAPGVSILSSITGSSYSYFSGTSMATPHVAGALALLAGYAPQLSWQQLKNALLQSVVPLASLSARTATGGMLNLRNLLGQATPPTPAPTATAAPTSTPTVTPTPTNTPTPTRTPTPTPTPVPGYYTLTGFVLTTQGTPVVGAKLDVVADSASGAVRTVYTGADGSFAVSNIWGPTNYSVQGSKLGFGINPHRGYLTSNTSISITAIPSPFALSVQVMRRDKSALAGVDIYLSSPTLGMLGTGVTDGQGKVLFSAPANVQYVIEAAHPDYIFNVSQLSGEIAGDTDRVLVAIPR